MSPPLALRHSTFTMARQPPTSGRAEGRRTDTATAHVCPGAQSSACQKPETSHAPVFGPEARAASAPCDALVDEPTDPNWLQPANTAPPLPAISKLGLASRHWPAA